jgi:hypothetical protein
MLPDYDRAWRIQLFNGNPKTRTLAELLIDPEESPHARGVVLVELRDRKLRRESYFGRPSSAHPA